MFGRALNTSLHILAFRLKYFLVACAFNDCHTVKLTNKRTNNRLHGYYKLYIYGPLFCEIIKLLKLPETSVSRYGSQEICFKGSLIWNTVPNKIKNVDNIEDFKKHIKGWKPTTCSCKLCL